MTIRQSVRFVAVSLTLCFAVTVLSSATVHCAEQQAEPATSAPKHRSVVPAPRIAEWWFARQAEKIGLMTNEDDIILAPGEIEYLSDVFGKRARIYPTGGHCGNMNHPVNVVDMVNFFKREG